MKHCLLSEKSMLPCWMTSRNCIHGYMEKLPANVVESESQYVQKSAEHTLEKPRHNIYARCIWTGSDRKHTIKTGLRSPRPRRLTSGQGKTR